jgi:hypothetical protein
MKAETIDAVAVWSAGGKAVGGPDPGMGKAPTHAKLPRTPYSAYAQASEACSPVPHRAHVAFTNKHRTPHTKLQAQASAEHFDRLEAPYGVN